MRSLTDAAMPARWLAPIPASTRRHLARQLIGDAADAPEPAEPIAPDVVQADAQADAQTSVIEPTVGPTAVADPAAAVVALVAGKLGLVSVAWPGIAYPFWVRGGTDDAARLIEALRDTTARLRIPFAPRRIVEIGAGAGYRSVALAIAHPDATIVSVEPMPGTARLHALNTLPWRQIVAVRAVVSQSAPRYALADLIETGQQTLTAAEAGPIPALGLEALYRQIGWDTADVLVIDPAACPDLAAGPAASELGHARLVAIARPGPDRPVADAWRARFPDATHAHRSTAGYEMFFRREVEAPMPPPRRLLAFDPGGAAIVLERHDVAAEPWGFFPIGEAGFRLHPNGPGAAAPTLVLRHFLAGPRRFETGLRLNHAAARPVRFSVSLRAVDGARVIHRADTVLAGGETRDWGFDLPLFFGEARVEFATAMADAADGNGCAWAEFLDPGFV